MSVYGTVHDTNGSSTRRDCAMLRNKSRYLSGEVISVTQKCHAGGRESFSAKISSVTTGGGGGGNLDRRKGLSRVTEFVNGP